MVVGSALVHTGLLGLVFVSPSFRVHEQPRVIAVELIQPSAPAAPQAAPKPAPVPEPAPAPPPEAAPEPPPPPKPKQVVLPEKPTAPKPPDKAKPKPREKEVFKEPPKKQEKDLDELLAEMRGSDTTKPSASPAPTQAPVDTATATTGPTGTPSEGIGEISPEEAAWRARVRQKMKGIWIVPPGFRTQQLQTLVVVTLDGAGNIVGEPRIKKKSGNPWYDDSVMRGLAKASTLPAPPEAGDWVLQFEPGDSL
jgi:outer membrane biosynthesis protein TonB